MTNCPFCKIAEGTASASLVYEDDNVLAFLDINPSNIGHTLVVPRDHWENIFEIPEKILTEIIIVTKKISIAIKKTVNAEGIKIIQLNGRVAGQMVMHIHFHIIPILFEFEKIRDHVRRIKTSREKLDETAMKIIKNL